MRKREHLQNFDGSKLTRQDFLNVRDEMLKTNQSACINEFGLKNTKLSILNRAEKAKIKEESDWQKGLKQSIHNMEVLLPGRTPTRNLDGKLKGRSLFDRL